jgi:hypothetical protein
MYKDLFVTSLALKGNGSLIRRSERLTISRNTNERIGEEQYFLSTSGNLTSACTRARDQDLFGIFQYSARAG